MDLITSIVLQKSILGFFFRRSCSCDRKIRPCISRSSKKFQDTFLTIYIIRFCVITTTLFIFLFQNSYAAQYPLPSKGNSIIGDLSYTSGANESIESISKRYDLGVNAIISANPSAASDAVLPDSVLIPTQHLLPSLPHKGIVINLAEMRMYYYPKDSDTVMTFPIGIGRVGRTVPTGYTAITKKVHNPSWSPPEDIRNYVHVFQEIDLPRTMGPGPDNPLGHYALYLRVPTFLIHSTLYPDSIGRRASFGCIRMNESDIKELFSIIKAGTSVAIIDSPNKVGWQDNKLYLEMHPPLQEHPDRKLDSIVAAIQRNMANDGITLVDWQMVSYLARERDGVPHEIGIRIL